MAVLLVVLFHAGVSGLSGGYVGVDVFFVISGFVITGVLLRERAATEGTSILAFYGRRCRRIIPAATLVIVVTVILAYALLGVVGNRTATDGIWAAVFLANFHFAATGTNYLTAQQPPSPLQNFWTLSVEEQFYVVFPSLFALVARARFVLGFRARLILGLGVVIVASFTISVVQTAGNPAVAYFSPFTRAWELALGALVAVATPWLLRLPTRLAAPATWVGLGAIALAAVSYDSHTAYPGSAAALPVVGTALVIAGGTVAPRFGAESLLRIRPLGLLGKLSYSLYLWHWPILILAAESAGVTSLPVTKNLEWLVVALGLSIATYVIVENPIRRSRPLLRSRWASVALGIGLIAFTLLIMAVELHLHSPGNAEAAVPGQIRGTTASPGQVERLVAAAPRIQKVPDPLDPPIGSTVLGYPWKSPCWAGFTDTTVPLCLFGDPRGTKSMVVVGDSHAQMWFYTIDAIAERSHWRLYYLAKSACPVALLRFTGDEEDYGEGGEYGQCDVWHQFVIHRIDQLDPDLVIVSQEDRQPPNNGTPYSSAQWESGMAHFFRSISAPRAEFIDLGNIPMLPQTGPDCIARHTDDVQACSAPVAEATTPYHRAEADAVESVGGRYIDPTPWLCSAVCTPVIGDYDVYFDHYHLMGPYALFLEGVLAQALRLPPSGDSATTRGAVLRTRMLVPSSGAVVSGVHVLDAGASDDVGDTSVGVSRVEFRVTGGTEHHALVATATLTLVGWIAYWDTATLPNGTYRLQSEALDATGRRAYSAAIVVQVKN